jgi:hypothetical protein
MNGKEASICWIFLEVTKKITKILGNIESFEVDFRYQISILFILGRNQYNSTYMQGN